MWSNNAKKAVAYQEGVDSSQQQECSNQSLEQIADDHNRKLFAHREVVGQVPDSADSLHNELTAVTVLQTSEK